MVITTVVKVVDCLLCVFVRRFLTWYGDLFAATSEQQHLTINTGWLVGLSPASRMPIA
jgi:hypothetical protein